MVLRLKSLRQLGKTVRLANGIRLLPVAKPKKREMSVPQRALWTMVREKYPDAESEASGLVPGRKYSVDILIPRLLLICEVDGWDSHGRYLSGFLRDREKDRALLLAGFRVIRFTAGEIMKDPWTVMETFEQVVRMLEDERINHESQTDKQ